MKSADAQTMKKDLAAILTIVYTGTNLWITTNILTFVGIYTKVTKTLHEICHSDSDDYVSYIRDFIDEMSRYCKILYFY